MSEQMSEVVPIFVDQFGVNPHSFLQPVRIRRFVAANKSNVLFSHTIQFRAVVVVDVVDALFVAR